MKKILIFLLCFLGWMIGLRAQSYDAAAGIRFGTTWGLTGQYRIGNKTTLEGIIQSPLGKDEVILTLLAEAHKPLISRRLNFYMGGGLHKGWIGDKEEEIYEDPFGVTLIGGAEFTFARMVLSYDIKPSFNLTGGEKTVYFHTGLSLRYVLAKRKWLSGNKNKRKNKRDPWWKFWQ